MYIRDYSEMRPPVMPILSFKKENIHPSAPRALPLHLITNSPHMGGVPSQDFMSQDDFCTPLDQQVLTQAKIGIVYVPYIDTYRSFLALIS